MTLGQGIEIASINLHICRLMLLTGILRVAIKGERLPGGLNFIDKIIFVWAGWAILASLFHDQERYGVVYACGAVFNLGLTYFLVRIWCNDISEISGFVYALAWLLVPLALEMILEKATGRNLFSVFGGVSEFVQSREGKLRAQGPFLHAILAGTVGAASIPLFIGLYYTRFRTVAIIGIAAGLIMTFASASSGPVMTLLAGLGATMLWRFRKHLSTARKAGVILYLFLVVVMSRPPYYLIGEIDLAGGSTGWHRANLIEMTFKHLSEWWLFGTDVTRHWMPQQGIGADPQHTDITNYYIGMGVFAGLPAMLAIIGVFWIAFRWVGKVLDTILTHEPDNAFMIWCFGASLFAHAVTGVSVSYFDQSVLFLWTTVAIISSGYSIGYLTNKKYDDLELSLEKGFDPQSAFPAGQSHIRAVNREWRNTYRSQFKNTSFDKE